MKSWFKCWEGNLNLPWGGSLRGSPCLGLDPDLRDLPECPWPLDTWHTVQSIKSYAVRKHVYYTRFIWHTAYSNCKTFRNTNDHKLLPVQVTSVIQQPEKLLFVEKEKDSENYQSWNSWKIEYSTFPPKNHHKGFEIKQSRCGWSLHFGL